MYLATKEKRFAKQIVKRLLKSHSVISVEKSDLSGKALYREVLLHTQHVDSSRVDQVLRQAEDSIDLWTTGSMDELGFRQVVHFVVMLRYRAVGHTGAAVSFRDIVYSLIPPDL
jgi:ethanolamine utilization protein EutA (predicted chaperonin)